MATFKDYMARAQSHNASLGQYQPSLVYLNQTPLDLDYLIHTLRNPTPDITVQKVLGYIYHYIPYVKYEHNLKLVISSFLNNTVCFGSEVPSFEANYLIVEVFKLITDKKLRISQPTLSVKTFYEVILKELQHFVQFNPVDNSWKVLPVISGLFLSNDLRNELYTRTNLIKYSWFFNDWDSQLDSLFKRAFQYSISRSRPDNIVDLSLLSWAVKHNKGEPLAPYIGRIDPGFLVQRLINLVYGLGSPTGAYVYTTFANISPQDPGIDDFVRTNVTQKPVIKHLSKLTLLLEALLGDLPYGEASFELIMSTTEHMLAFNRDMNHFTAKHPALNIPPSQMREGDTFLQQYWFLMKGILFSEVIVFQGIISRFATAKNHNSFFSLIFSSGRHVARMENEYRQICTRILHSLYYVNYILTSIGQGGFDGYNFVYYLSLEVVLQNNRNLEFESFSRYLIGNYNEVNLHYQVMNADYVARGKVLFVLGLWENYLQQSKLKDPSFVNFVFTTTFDIVKSPHMTDYALIEAGHSVLLVYFSNREGTDKDMHQVLQYSELLLAQFPRLLSATQLSVAVETLGKKIMSRPVIYGNNSLHKTSADEFLDLVYFKCFSTTPGQFIRPSTNATFSSAQPIMEIDAASTMSQLDNADKTDIVDANKEKKPKDMAFDLVSTSQPDTSQNNFTVRVAPETSREAVISAFINIVPYLPLNIFVHWLIKIWGLIDASNMSEKTFLTEKLWKVLSENLDLNRCEIAYAWWYETMAAVETNMGHRISLLKL